MHLQYPADLRHNAIEAFKKELGAKVKALHQKSRAGGDHLSYLQSFGPFQVAKIRTEEVSPDVLVMGMLRDIQTELSWIRNYQSMSPSVHTTSNGLLAEIVARGGMPDSSASEQGASSQQMLSTAGIQASRSEAMQKAIDLAARLKNASKNHGSNRE
ncbi:hypothetical protein [Pandoraea horticolens]|uniref:hypothetical protein n=1 Tax=Pandoraea horticolens TaxID=2508298 RepID=UPI0012403603|nr:hypothetical protein [Pandoraea horticolens]